MSLADLPVRILNRIVISDGCWEYAGSHTSGGYAKAYWEGGPKTVHRLVYEAVVGPIPDGLDIDHLCRNRACVRADHMEPVTRRVNVLRGIGSSAQHARQTHCVHGHPFDEANTYRHPNGTRRCRECNRIRLRARKDQNALYQRNRRAAKKAA